VSEDARRKAFELFDQICDLPAAEQTHALEKHCGEDAALRDMVERMLGHDARSDDDDLPPGTGAELIATQIFDETPTETPTKIGRYRIIREIGHGGMGVVYEAEQAEPQRRVAVKVIRQGLRSREMVRRFQREAQLLGRLQHPGVAQIIEAGTDHSEHGKRPFYAMEFVEGLPIDLHADQHNLNINDRIELIARVCDAVQHAHQKGILHRDLKAANVLVATSAANEDDTHASGTMIDTIGQPKVLDFGIARLTDGTDFNTQHTVAGQILGSLACMSPEQLSGDRASVDTRADVYAIGVMLYRLLAGRMPHDLTGMSMPEAARTVTEKEPATLSTVDKSLRGDLSVIAAKALERDIERRYASVALLGEDLRRVLRDEPITARPPSTRYRLIKYARRNKGIATVAAASIVLLITAVFVSTGFGIKATIAQKEAVSALRSADQAAYRAAIAAAAAALKTGDAQLATTFLERAPKEFRGWEWHHLAFESDRSIATGESEYMWGEGPAMFLSGRFWLNEEEAFLFTARTDLELKLSVFEVHELPSLRSLGAWGLEPDEICVGRFDDGGKILTYNNADQMLVARSAVDGRELSRCENRGIIRTLAKSFDALPSSVTAKLERSNLDAVLTPPQEHLNTGAIHPERKYLMPWRGIRALANPLLPELAPIDFGPVTEGLSNAAFSPDGALVAITSLHRQLDLFDLSTGMPVWRHANAHDDLPLSIAFSRDGKLLATGGQDLVIKIWEVVSGKLLGRLVGHKYAISGITFDASGEILYSGDATVVKKWRVRDAISPGVAINHSSYVSQVLVNNSGSHLVASVVSYNPFQAPMRDIRGLRIEDDTVIGPFEMPANVGHLQAVYFLDSDRLGVICTTVEEEAKESDKRPFNRHATTRHQLLVFDPSNGKLRQSIDLDIMRVSWPWRVGDKLIVDGKPALAIDLESLVVTKLDAAPLPRGPVSTDGILQWRNEAGTITHAWPEITERPGAFVVDDKNGRAFVATGDRELHALDLRTGKRIKSIKIKDYPRKLALLPDGTRLFGSDFSAAIQVWNTSDLELVAVLRGHRDSVRDLVVTPNGNTLYSASDDFTVREWRSK